jgi:predicted 3-demethylubiquinone-9 3-methyltransferase (glyoxalase superfamily)
MTDSKSGNPGKAMEALLKMGKLDIATLEKAYKS